MAEQRVLVRAIGGGFERNTVLAPGKGTVTGKFHIFADPSARDRLLWICTDIVDPATLKHRAGVALSAHIALRGRILAMSEQPIAQQQGGDFPPLIWPLEVLQVGTQTVGFSTHVASQADAISFDAASRAHWPYDRRLQAARALAQAMALVHAAGHRLTGLDPATIFVRPSGEISISDCTQVRPKDPKSKRHLGSVLPPPHLRAPEVKRQEKEADEEPQDLYALAILIYQMLADGALPVQTGRYVHATEQARGSGWFAKWPADLQALFDRALSERGKKKERPSAQEWDGVLQEILQRARICEAKAVEHGAAILCPNGGCALCAAQPSASPAPAARPAASTAAAAPSDTVYEDLPPPVFSVRATTTPRAAPAAAPRGGNSSYARERTVIEEQPLDGDRRPFDMSTLEQPRLFDWRVAGGLAAASAVAAFVVGVAAYFVTPPGRLVAEGPPPWGSSTETAVADGAPINERMALRPSNIGAPILSGAMADTTEAGFAEVEFTVRPDGAASAIRVTRESTPGIGYAEEATRLVGAATWPTRWRSRTAPFPASYRVNFPAGVSEPIASSPQPQFGSDSRRGVGSGSGTTFAQQRPLRNVSPVYVGQPQLTPAILAMGRDGSVVVAVLVNARGIVDDARVLSADPVNPALYSEALRVAMAARFPVDRSGAGYETRMTIPFFLPASAKGPEQTGPVLALSDMPFTRRPDAGDFIRNYPPRAQRESINGRVVMLCTAQPDLTLACSVLEENPVGVGFGEAALQIARSFRVARQFPDGRSTQGAQVRVPLSFRME